MILMKVNNVNFQIKIKSIWTIKTNENLYNSKNKNSKQAKKR